MAEKATKTLYVKECAIVYNGVRHEIGDAIEVTADDVKHIGKEYLTDKAPKKEEKK